MDPRRHMRNVARDMIRESRLRHVHVHAVLDHSDPNPLAPRRENDLIVVLMGWSPSLHPMRIPVSVPAISVSRDGATSFDVGKLRKEIKAQTHRFAVATKEYGIGAKPLARTLDVPIEMANPDVSRMKVMPYLFRHLVAIEGSREDAIRRIGIGVETMLRRRESRSTAGSKSFSMQEDRFDEEIELAPGLRSKHCVLKTTRDHLPVMTSSAGRPLGEFFDVPGLDGQIIRRQNGYFLDRVIILDADLHEWTRIDVLVEAMGAQRDHSASQEANPEEPCTPMPWSTPSGRVACAMRQGGIEDVSSIAMMTDDELMESCSADGETVIEMRRHASSALRELLEMNAGRLVRRS